LGRSTDFFAATLTSEEPAPPRAENSRRARFNKGDLRFYSQSRLPRRAEAVVEALDGRCRRRSTEQVRGLAFGSALRLGARLSLRRRLGRESNCRFLIRRLRLVFGRTDACRRHRGMFRRGVRRLGLVRGWLARRLVIRHRGLVLAFRSEEIASNRQPPTCLPSCKR
jgi:hypothetical protein